MSQGLCFYNDPVGLKNKKPEFEKIISLKCVQSNFLIVSEKRILLFLKKV